MPLMSQVWLKPCSTAPSSSMASAMEIVRRFLGLIFPQLRSRMPVHRIRYIATET